jgi:MFS family permease
MTPPDRRTVATTFRLENFRAPFSGVLETAGQTFLILIAVEAFDAGAGIKSLLVASGPLGLLLSPLGVTAVRLLGWTASRGAAAFAGLAAAGFAMAATGGGTAFVAGCLAGCTASMMTIPLMTQVYQDNYPREERGRLFSRTIILRMVAAAAFSWLGGHWLEESPEHFRWIVAAFAAASAAGAILLARLPSRPLRGVGAHPLRGWRHVGRDRAFRWLLISWMFMGFGNLMMFPLRVDYIANPAYGIQLHAQQVALLTGVVPGVVMLAFSPLWGPVFDRYNFYVIRALLNLGFVAGMAAYFLVGGMAGFLAGAIFFGISMSGGNIAWSLWVTKIAKPADVADYMAVHTTTTGIRGLLAPAAGFWLVAHIGIAPLAWISIALVIIGTSILAPETTTLRRRRPGEPVVPRDFD